MPGPTCYGRGAMEELAMASDHQPVALVADAIK